MLARALPARGHRPIVVVGGGTGHDRRSERQGDGAAADPDEATSRRTRRRSRAARALSRLRPDRTPRAMVDNADWLAALSRRRVHARRRQALHRELHAAEGLGAGRASEAGISYTEFSYMLLQAYDFLRAAPAPRRAALQMGGSDQWGNITPGIELIRRIDGRRRARDHVAARHDGGGHQVRQDGGGRGLARPGADVAVQVLSVLGERGRPRRREVPALLHAARASEIEALDARIGRAPRGSARRSGALAAR